MEARVATVTTLTPTRRTRARALVKPARRAPDAARPSARGCAPGSASLHHVRGFPTPGPVGCRPGWRLASRLDAAGWRQSETPDRPSSPVSYVARAAAP